MPPKKHCLYCFWGAQLGSSRVGVSHCSQVELVLESSHRLPH